jgi:hypothetical protein
MIVIVTLCVTVLLYSQVVGPWLHQNCLFDTSTCLQIRYHQYKNSVLVQVLPAGYWIFFNGSSAFVYQPSTSDVTCTPGYDPVYEMDKTTGVPHSLVCIDSLDKVKHFYTTEKRVKPKTLYKRVDNLGAKGNSALKQYQNPVVTKLDAQDVLNLLQQKNIINLKKIHQT